MILIRLKYNTTKTAIGLDLKKELFSTFWLLLFFILPAIPAKAQFTCGMSGSLNSPSASLPPDGTFSFGGNYLPSALMPADLKYNSGNYYLNVTFFSFMELSYRSTFLRCESLHPLKHKYTWNKDRSVGLKLRIFPQGRKWRPALAIGSNDVVTTKNVINLTNDPKGNKYFASVYGVISRSFPLREQTLLLSAGYYVPFYKNSDKKGIFGSVQWTPPKGWDWFSLWGEYDCDAVNLGIRTCFFRHLELQVFCYDFKAVSCGIRYSVNLLGRRAKCGQ
ncbi:MAG: YjbH domain-containing protein [Bacteroidales bacterium]